MQIIEAKAEIIWTTPHSVSKVSEAASTCYKSKHGDWEADKRRAESIIRNNHSAMLEFADMAVRFTVDRGVSHELVRHRLCSFAQESTRYCNYSNDTFNGEITVIKPCFLIENSPSYRVWKETCRAAEDAYFKLLDIGETPERARSVLPTSLKTELIMKANLREWRHFFQLRALGTTGKPHPQMVEVARPLLRRVAELTPVIFDDLLEVLDGE